MTVTLGGILSLKVTVLSVLVLMGLVLPARSDTFPALIDGIKVPFVDMAMAERVKFLWSPESLILHVIRDDGIEPFWVISPVVKVPTLIGSEKVTAKLTGVAVAGSDCPEA